MIIDPCLATSLLLRSFLKKKKIVWFFGNDRNPNTFNWAEHCGDCTPEETRTLCQHNRNDYVIFTQCLHGHTALWMYTANHSKKHVLIDWKLSTVVIRPKSFSSMSGDIAMMCVITSCFWDIREKLCYIFSYIRHTEHKHSSLLIWPRKIKIPNDGLECVKYYFKNFSVNIVLSDQNYPMFHAVSLCSAGSQSNYQKRNFPFVNLT